MVKQRQYKGKAKSSTIEANWRMVQQLIKDSDMPETPNTATPDTVPMPATKPGNVCTIHIMFPVANVSEAAIVAAALDEVTKDLPDVINDFRVSDARIAPRRMQPNG